MITRQLVLPVEPEQLWSALTDGEQLRSWFGGAVEWELAPGGHARWLDDDGSERVGVVREVCPCRRLAWQWWPAAGGVADDGVEASEVIYVLEAVDEGTQLTVTERRSSEPPGAHTGGSASSEAGGTDGSPRACAGPGSSGGTAPASTRSMAAAAAFAAGDGWGLRLTGLWLAATNPAAVAAVA